MVAGCFSFGRSCRYRFIKCFSTKVLNYNGHIWGNQGPQRLTSALKIYCKTFNSHTTWPYGSNAQDAEVCIPKFGAAGQGLSVLNSRYGYPVHYTKWNWLLDDTKSKKVLQWLGVNKVFAIHLWNGQSKGKFKHIPSPSSAYAAIASRHCPTISKMLFQGQS